MIYIFILIGLFILELVYFKVADKFNIIDKPNERSSHSTITLRGGGIIFYFAALIYFVQSGFQYPWFFLGLSLMTIISFLDDIFTLSNKVRLLIHFVSVLLMTYQLEVFSMPWYYLLLTFIIIVGVINAYNFMDGINGITACYSLSVGVLLSIVNNKLMFIDQNLLTYSLLGVIVFSFFNFRMKAKCFAGDVGSVAIAYILLFALGALIMKTGNLIYILFLAVYGLDAVWTIIRRLLRRENIFEAHRSHLYQFLANEAKVNKLLVSFVYGLLQFIVGYLVIQYADASVYLQLIFAIVLLTFLSAVYLILKTYIVKKYAIH
ncbi:glycosyltransferase family 4 protein [Sphingobacterium sp. UME9]|uniref:MraY family glycosyltransferase n=1 Tax=Sphingobacterium sp. UME9 TaxID=1862316 RepID=UPI0016017344|nr:glycosyltransferase family 4 protein [Sphingobacterium sp. UME9]MBB1645568.1 UDP-GlcNAc--UDP-phosphate GlcNAc-1-phosphate transferase [Sphingobacterium sp. UME9]